MVANVSISQDFCVCLEAQESPVLNMRKARNNSACTNSGCELHLTLSITVWHYIMK